MIFEEALSKLREGKKIRHSSFDEDVYLQSCINVIGVNKLSDEEFSKLPLSITWMKGKYEHPNMRPKIGIYDKPCVHGNYPQLNLLILMRDDWEVIE